MEVRIEASVASQRLDKAVAELTDLSRSLANEQIKDGLILVNGQAKKANMRSRSDVISMSCLSQKWLSMWQRYSARNRLSNEDVAVVKTAGDVVHPSAGHTSGTLVNALMYHIKVCLASTEFYVRGLSIGLIRTLLGFSIAKNDQAHVALADELKNKKSLRKYWAIVHGNCLTTVE